MNNNDIPVWEKYTLTIEEASKYDIVNITLHIFCTESLSHLLQ